MEINLVPNSPEFHLVALELRQIADSCHRNMTDEYRCVHAEVIRDFDHSEHIWILLSTKLHHSLPKCLQGLPQLVRMQRAASFTARQLFRLDNKVLLRWKEWISRQSASQASLFCPGHGNITPKPLGTMWVDSPILSQSPLQPSSGSQMANCRRPTC